MEAIKNWDLIRNPERLEIIEKINRGMSPVAAMKELLAEWEDAEKNDSSRSAELDQFAAVVGDNL